MSWSYTELIHEFSDYATKLKYCEALLCRGLSWHAVHALLGYAMQDMRVLEEKKRTAEAKENVKIEKKKQLEKLKEKVRSLMEM